MADTANPTRPGMLNYLHPPARQHDPANPRKAIDSVFGDEAPIIEGLPIEVGHGCKPPEWQCAEHLARVFAASGRDEARALLQRLLGNSSLNQQIFAAELVARGLMSPATAAAKRTLEEFAPEGPPQ